MIVTFNVVTSSGDLTPPKEYFQGLERQALHALNSTTLSYADAWAWCEYLDAVDGGDWPMNRAHYRQCVAALGEYITPRMDTPEVARLAGHSWAAHTLVELLENGVSRKATRLRIA